MLNKIGLIGGGYIGGVLAQDCLEGVGKIAGRDALEIQGRNQGINTRYSPEIRRQDGAGKPLVFPPVMDSRLLDMDRAVAAGLFGPAELPPESRNRLGDLLLLACDGSRLIPAGETADHRGEHGSLTPEEMLVPLLMARLDA